MDSEGTGKRERGTGKREWENVKVWKQPTANVKMGEWGRGELKS
jgi:hypothetical protein